MESEDVVVPKKRAVRKPRKPKTSVEPALQDNDNVAAIVTPTVNTIIVNHNHEAHELQFSPTVVAVSNTVTSPPDLTTVRRRGAEAPTPPSTLPVMSRFERAKIISERADQIAKGGIITFRNDTGEFETPIEIAKEELRRKTIPFSILRNMPDGTVEKWNVKDFLY
jgi:DNA-directed RNA polymerase subunit K/omega